MVQMHKPEGYYTCDWLYSDNDTIVIYINSCMWKVASRLYLRDAGVCADRLKKIKQYFLRLLVIAGPRFTTTDKIMEYAELFHKQGMHSFMMDIPVSCMFKDPKRRMLRTELITYSIMDTRAPRGKPQADTIPEKDLALLHAGLWPLSVQ